MEEKAATETKQERKRQPTREESSSSILEKKAQAILDSKMPEEQKQAYLKQIGWITPASDEGKVTFATYAKVRKISKDRMSALSHYPKAKSVRLATLEDWDNIFKNF